MNYLPVFVYSSGKYDCSNNGVTVTSRDKLVVPCEDGHITEEEVAQRGYTVLVPGKILDSIHFKPKGVTGHTMFGGNFVCTSDSRFAAVYGRQPVHVHDRIER